MRMCGGCDADWGQATKVCHCAACHETFTTVANFDRHRDRRGEHGSCKNPAKAGLVLSGRAYLSWMSPGDANSEVHHLNLRASRKKGG